MGNKVFFQVIKEWNKPLSFFLPQEGNTHNVVF